VVQAAGQGPQTVLLHDKLTGSSAGEVRLTVSGGSPAISGLPHTEGAHPQSEHALSHCLALVVMLRDGPLAVSTGAAMSGIRHLQRCVFWLCAPACILSLIPMPEADFRLLQGMACTAAWPA
jgi:hypothetical protein